MDGDAQAVVVEPGSKEVTATLSPADQREATMLNEEDGTGEAVSRSKEWKPFFEEEVSEAELMGQEEGGSKKIGDDSAATQAKPKEEAKEPLKEEKKETVEEKKETPPVGFVPKGALHEEREKRKQLQAEVEQLRRQLDPKEAGKDVLPEEQAKPLLKTLGLPEDFKVLTEAEEDSMMEEDLFAYNRYQRNLRKYERASQDLTTKQRTTEEITTRTARIVEGAVKRMEESVPGIHEPGSEINKQLTAYALENGLDNDYLNALTDPKTMFLPAGAKEPMYLGDGAAALVEFIHTTYKSRDLSAVKATMEKEITERVTGELMKKFTTGKGKPNFKSLGDAPGSADVQKNSSFGEKDFAKMSEDEQRLALGG